MPPTSASCLLAPLPATFSSFPAASATVAATLAVFADLLAILLRYFPDTYPLLCLHLVILPRFAAASAIYIERTYQYRKV